MRRVVVAAVGLVAAALVTGALLDGDAAPSQPPYEGWTPHLVPSPGWAPTPPSTVPQGEERPTGIVLLPPATARAAVYPL